MRSCWLIPLTVSLWLLLTALEVAIFVSRGVSDAQSHFDQQASHIADTINQQILANEAVIDSYAAYTLAAGNTSDDNERLFVLQVMRRYPQLLAMERIERVEPWQRNGVLALLRQRYGSFVDYFGYDPFTRKVSLALPPHAVLYPIIFIEPMRVATRVLGLDMSYALHTRLPLFESARLGQAVSSQPFPLVEGQMGYLLIRPAYQAASARAATEPQSFVAIVINSEPLVPAASQLSGGVGVRLWHRGWRPDDALGLFFERGGAQRSRLEVALFPRLETERQIGSTSQPFMLRVSRQLGWTLLEGFQWGVMALLSLGMLGLLYLGLRARLLAQEARRAHQNLLQYQAHHDSLTGLPNRALLRDRLQHAIARQQRSGTRLALLFLDLNRFKPINDRYGHAAGDQVLKVIGARLLALLRAVDTVARVGGDEFVILLEEMTEEQLPEVVARIAAAVEEPIEVEGVPLSVGTSIGVAWYPEDGESVDGLLEAADREMYHQKEAGVGR
jgi:diguanylate cyclase (GGDEF)-like protein